ncbi:3'(2'),5'-bisphosphate nucleotidase CysQ [Microbacterium sp. RU33B]|uniref:3'(2'),5'-bisphosphate nucleotidase CysQ n=1 Tax=Microbacterium sp. RU33B TaxID=1907390 RepID=UPI000960BB44|nr:3'(2'),5'-bisphosphate nucleotidase CysQ [Microbacterium sp. RU33B]SIT84316.1 3'(2'),5'-bisphosphate nucleotidase [Microbacterium sp. RU33B]
MIDDNELAAELARDAGARLLEVQRSAEPAEIGTAALKDRGDRVSQEFLATALTEHRADDAVLSEEAADDSARLSADRVWIIDPLDGTREFSENRHDWAVHVALWERGELAAGAVSLPAEDIVLSAADAAQEWERPARIRLAVSRSRASALVQALAEELDAELVPMGSAGFKVAAVVRGDVDAYVHTGGQYEWDSAAPVAVARAAGLFTSRVDGSPLEYNRENPYLPDLVVCNPLLADDLLRRLDALMERES